MSNKEEKKLQRLNLILRTVRSVDQVILEERERDRLIKGVCDSLVKTRGYYNAWIALLDNSGKFATFSQSELGERFSALVKQLKSGKLTSCSKSALAKSNAVVTNDPASNCTDCPLAKEYVGRGGITAGLRYRGKLFGLLCASVPASLATEMEERSLFEDIAGDVAFALYEIELEEERELVEEALRESEKRYRVLFDGANDGMIVRDLEGNILMVNNAMAELTGYTTDELIKMNISQFLPESSLQTVAEKQRRRIKEKSEASIQRYELQMLRKDGAERTIDVASSLLPDREQSMIVQVIVRDVTEQKQHQENLRAYANRAILAQEEERKRVARELHDDTAQALASLGMDIDSLVKEKDWRSTEIPKRLEGLRDRTNDILLRVRSLSQALRPPMLEDLGLIAAFHELTDDLENQHGINAQFNTQGTARRLLPDVELALFRIAQEALSNVWKHSQASKCLVNVEFKRDKIKLIIKDNGKGFELNTVGDNSDSSVKLGLIGMQERAKLIDGILAIRSEPGKGTSITLEAYE